MANPFADLIPAPAGAAAPAPRAAAAPTVGPALPDPVQKAIRQNLFPGEDAYFRANPTVGGMMTDDDRIILNPHSTLSPQEKSSVATNEYARLLMRRGKMTPPAPTPEQRAAFRGTPYGADDAALSQTIIARILSGDPSAGRPTDEQRAFAERLGAQMPAAPAPRAAANPFADLVPGARVASTPSPQAGFLERRATDLGTSVLGLQQAGQALTVVGADNVERQADARLRQLQEMAGRATQDFERQAIQQQIDETLRQRGVAQQSFAPAVAEVGRLKQEMAARPTSPEFQRFGQALQSGNLGDGLSAVAAAPIEVITSLIAQSGATMAPSVVGALAAGPAGAFVGEFGVELGLRLFDTLEAEGVDVSNPEAIRTAMTNDPTIRTRALGGAAAVAGTSAVGAGVARAAGRVVAGPGGLGRKAAAAGGGVVAGSVAGGAGEAAGSYITKGEVNPVEVLAEAIAELGGASVEVAGFSLQAFRAVAAKRRNVPPEQITEADVLDTLQRAGAGDTEAQATLREAGMTDEQIKAASPEFLEKAAQRVRDRRAAEADPQEAARQRQQFEERADLEGGDLTPRGRRVQENPELAGRPGMPGGENRRVRMAADAERVGQRVDEEIAAGRLPAEQRDAEVRRRLSGDYPELQQQATPDVIQLGERQSAVRGEPVTTGTGEPGTGAATEAFLAQREREAREAEGAFTLAERQRQRAGADVRDTQPGGRPEGGVESQQTVYLDEGQPVEVLEVRDEPRPGGGTVRVARVRAYNPRTGEALTDENGQVREYEMPADRLDSARYASNPRQAQDVEQRSQAPVVDRGDAAGRRADDMQGLPRQTYRTTEPDAEAGADGPATMVRSGIVGDETAPQARTGPNDTTRPEAQPPLDATIPLDRPAVRESRPEQGGGPASDQRGGPNRGAGTRQGRTRSEQRFRTAEEAFRAYAEAQRQRAEANARGEQTQEQRAEERAGERYAGTKSNNTGQKADDGSFDVDEDGYVRSTAGGPVIFGDQKQAARWILSSNKGRQIFEIANHPVKNGSFTVRQRGMTEDTTETGTASGGTAGPEAPGDSAQASSAASPGAPPATTAAASLAPDAPQAEAPERNSAGETDEQMLTGMPGAVFREGKGLARGKWFVEQDGKALGGPVATKSQAAQEARATLRRDSDRRNDTESTRQRVAMIADKLRAGQEITDDEVKFLGLRANSDFTYLSPAVQQLFGISARNVREAMGDALTRATTDMGAERWVANSRKALRNAAAYAQRQQDADAEAQAGTAEQTTGETDTDADADPPRGATQFYSNPFFAPAAWRALYDMFKPVFKAALKGTTALNRVVLERLGFPSVEMWQKNIAAIKAAKGGGPKALARAYSATRDVFHAILYSHDGHMRTQAARYKSPTLNRVLNMVRAQSGRAAGTVRSLREGIGMREDSQISKLGAILGDFIEDRAAMAQIRELVQNRSRIRAGTDPIHVAAKKLADWLDEHLDYMRKSGVDIGNVKYGYFPRELDAMTVLANRDKFLTAATTLYRKAGLNAKDAKAAAEAWYEEVTFSGGSVFRPETSGDGSFFKSRAFGKEADKMLADFYVPDIGHVLILYTQRAARRGEIARRFGDRFSKWEKEMIPAMRAEGAGDMVQATTDYLLNAAGAMKTDMGASGRRLLSGIHTMGTLGLLEQAVFTSLPEMFMPALRSNDTLGVLAAPFQAVGDLLRTMAGLPLRERLLAAKELAEDLGAIAGDGMYSLQAQRFAIEDQLARVQSATITKFFAVTGLEQFTRWTRIQATKSGALFVRRLSRTLAGQDAGWAVGGKGGAAAFLRELGVPEGQEAAFARFVAGLGDDIPNPTELTGAMGDIYRTAVYRFVEQSIMRPDTTTRPKWASTPFGRVAFHLQNYGYVFGKNVLARPLNAYRSVAAGEAPPIYAAVMTAQFVLLATTLVAAQAALSEGRDEIDRQLRKALGQKGPRSEQSDMAKAERAVSRAGLLGALDPYWNFLSGVRYNRGFLEFVAGPTLGSFAGVGTTAAAAIVRNSDKTNAAERKLAQVTYRSVAEPAAQAAIAAALPVGLLAFMLSVGVRYGEEPAIDAAAGPDQRRQRPRTSEALSEQLAKRIGAM